MKYREQIFFFIFILSAVRLFAQDVDGPDPMPIRLKAQILNIADESPVPYVFVMNLRTHSGVTTDEMGRFTMEMLNIDSLSMSSLSFTKMTAHLPANYKEANVQTFYLRPIRYAIPEVQVSGEQKKVNMEGVPVGKKSNIDPSLRGNAFNEKPPILAAFFNPLSFIQYYTSKKEQEKRDVRKAILTEKHWETLSELYTKKLVIELTGLYDEKADELMIYINSKGLLSQMSNEYDVRSCIKEQYQLFKAEGH